MGMFYSSSICNMCDEEPCICPKPTQEEMLQWSKTENRFSKSEPLVCAGDIIINDRGEEFVVLQITEFGEKVVKSVSFDKEHTLGVIYDEEYRVLKANKINS